MAVKTERERERERSKSMLTRKAKLLWMTSHCLFTAIRLQSQNTEATDPKPLTLEPKINRLRQSAEDYYCAKFQVILIRGFCFILIIVSLPPSRAVQNAASKNLATAIPKGSSFGDLQRIQPNWNDLRI